ncbi:toprim domain-containing protein [Gorillibacterium massiliense]|uniref:toprim domain-containing protein n=1 Tax=Gorillibacterium massiliense TaxID=1280390 RepID=UPI0004AD1AF7|nr:toprim domain-containing protein [Gorillibacterium massiliense]
MELAIIVEGKNDRSRLKRLLHPDKVLILCTFGTPGTDKLERLRKAVGDLPVFIFTDNDPAGKKIRGLLRDTFPDSEQIYTRKGYAGVEGTPEEYLVEQLDKAGLSDYLNLE